jgi:shikimate kinase
VAGHTVLVGLSGTGKTSIGRRLASAVGCNFFDTDAEIEARTGRTVREIFADDGEDAFRAIEADVMADLLRHHEPSVIAAGGGAIVTESTRALLKAPDVFVVWLTASPEFLASRTRRKEHRPLLDDDPLASLTRLAVERRDWYEEVADATFDVQPMHHAAPKNEAKDAIARVLRGMRDDRRARRARDHVVLIGPMAAGKTTVGRAVADALGRPFVDSDEQLHATSRRTAREIAASDGLDALHTAERNAFRAAVTAKLPSVIAAAASVIDTSAGRAALESARDVVFLRVPADVARERERGGAHRPDVDPTEAARRAPLYESVATATVDVGDLEPDDVTSRVLRALETS